MLLTTWLSSFTKNSPWTRRPARRKMARAFHCTESLERRALLAADILVPLAGATFNATTGATVVVSGTATPLSTVNISADDAGAPGTAAVTASTTAAAGTGVWSVTLNLTSLNNGTITITADEPVGGAVEDTVTVTLDKTVPTLPTVTQLPSGTLTVTGEPGTTATLTLDPDGAGPAPANVVTAPIPVGGVLTLTQAQIDALTAGAADGLATVSTTLTDAAGNVTSAVPTPITIDNTTIAPVVGVTDPSLPLSDISTLGITVTGEPGGTATLTLDPDGSGPDTPNTVTVTLPASGTLTLTPAQVQALLDGAVPGTRTINTTITDAFGNTSTTTTTNITIENSSGRGGGGTVRVRVRRNGEVVIRPGRGQPASSLEVAQTATGLVLRGLNGTTIQNGRRGPTAATFALSSNAVTVRGRFGRSNDDVLFDNEGGTGNTNIIFNGRGGTNRYAPTDFLFGTRTFTNFSEVAALT